MPKQEKKAAEGEDSAGEPAVTAEAVVDAGATAEEATADAEEAADKAAPEDAHDEGDPAVAHIKSEDES